MKYDIHVKEETWTKPGHKRKLNSTQVKCDIYVKEEPWTKPGHKRQH